jgi:hypothetical protein
VRRTRPAPERADELACKPDSVPRRRVLARRRGGDHPSGHTVAGCLKRPTRRLGRAALRRLRCRTPSCDILGLASGGVCLATPVTRNAGALLPHRFTLTTAKVAVYFLWHFPASHLGLPLAITLLCEVRTFLEPRAAHVPPWFGAWAAAAQPTHPPYKRIASCGDSATNAILDA